MTYQSRIQKLQASIRGRRLDGILVRQPENRRYLSGYSAADHDINESSGTLLIPAKGNPFLLTDFRFELQARAEADDFTVIIHPAAFLTELKTLIGDLAIRKLGFESHYTLHFFVEKLMTLGDKTGTEMIPVSDIIEQMRLIKDDKEINYLRSSVLLNEEVFQEVYSQITPRQTEIDIALLLEATMRQKGAERASFESIVATGAGAALPHAVPGQTRVKKNQALMIDMGLVLNGYCSDMTRTFVPGIADKRYKQIHRLVRKAQVAGIGAIKDGVRAMDVDKAARKIIADAGFADSFGHALGHGVGMAVHENPRLSSRSQKILRAGMVVTVEPGIYLPDWGGVRLENMVVVRPDGCEVLNQDTTWLDI